jgi:hypothetical protein
MIIGGRIPEGLELRHVALVGGVTFFAMSVAGLFANFSADETGVNHLRIALGFSVMANVLFVFFVIGHAWSMKKDKSPPAQFIRNTPKAE